MNQGNRGRSFSGSRDNRGGNRGGGRDRGFSGNRGNSGGRFGGGRNFSSGPREMHKAICSECKQECEVPFKPTQGKPVYCRDCFAKHRD